MRERGRLGLAAALAVSLAACAHAPPGGTEPKVAPAPPPARQVAPAPPAAPPLAPGTPPAPEVTPPPPPGPPAAEEGVASYYARSLDGRRTASGERYDRRAMTCAHRSHAFGTVLRVTDLESGRSVVVTVNDRGPFAHGRVVDLSWAAARRLGILRRGLARVRVEPAGRLPAPAAPPPVG